MKTQESQFRAQLGALNLDGVAAREPLALGERRRLAGVILPELVLPVKIAPPPRRWQYAAFAAAALAAMVIVAWPRAHDDLQPKGAANVRVFFEHAGKVAPVDTTTRLQEGDRVRAELDAPAGGTAYWLVTDSSGKALVDAAFVRASAVSLQAGQTAPFAKSLQIVGPSVGEVLHVVACLQPANVRDGAPEELLRQSGCSDHAFTLRNP